MKYYQLLACIVICAWSFHFVQAEDTIKKKTYTPWFLKTGVGLNLNMHNASFTENASDVLLKDFETANGMGLDFNLGFEYLLNNNLWGKHQLRYAFDLHYTSLNATFDKDLFVGYVIQDNNYEKTVIGNSLNTKISALLNDHSLIFFPWNKGFGIKAGFGIGLPMSKKYETEKSVKSPQSVSFQDGSKTKIDDGELKGLSSMLFFANFGLRYELNLGKESDFTIVPSVDYRLGLNNVVSDQDWKISTINLAVSLQYRIPMATKPIPKPKTTPIIIEEIVQAVDNIDLALELVSDGHTLKNNETKVINVDHWIYKKNSFSYVPILFFDKNSISPLDIHVESIAGNMDIHTNNIIDKIAIALKDNPSLKLQLIATSTDEEKKTISDERINAIKIELNNKGIANNRILSKTKKYYIAKAKYPELITENRKLEFEFIGQSAFIASNQNINNEYKMQETSFELIPHIKSTSGRYTYQAGAKIGTKQFELGEKDGLVVLKQNMFTNEDFTKIHQIEIAAQLRNDKKEQNKALTLPIEFELNTKHSYLNFRTENNVAFEELILAYFDFDRSPVKIYDPLVKKRIEDAVEKGNKIEIHIYSDGLGTNQYNDKLSLKRGESIKKLLNLKDAKIIPSHSLFSNGNPFSRTLNRSAVVRIIK